MYQHIYDHCMKSIVNNRDQLKLPVPTTPDESSAVALSEPRMPEVLTANPADSSEPEPEIVGLDLYTDDEEERRNYLRCRGCDYFGPGRMYLCDRGHHLCSYCNARMKGKCPVKQQETGIFCEQPIGIGPHSDTLLFNTVVNVCNFSCPYRKLGCPEILNGLDCRVHAAHCEFRPEPIKEDPTITSHILKVCYVIKRVTPQYLVEKRNQPFIYYIPEDDQKYGDCD